MAFGLKRDELKKWKQNVENGQIDILTHFWLDERFPGSKTVTKVGCNDIEKLKQWGRKYGLSPEWIHRDPVHPHFDLFGEQQKRVLMEEGRWEQIRKFKL
ncbi:hypothetical protein D8M04_11265 [Oceanobacillus piezotolerans]|uniref:YneQ n=1 Tax=Oceanobacillus piezotolerans TaxID=2448030 RepID=A0A498DEK4_9BACI|nr:hypothetical protein [Oceanobacillus piezotolerans]RLL45424.1 hypothetical protein D8M04_11265 [Oceanobacillus piezotolerans]